MFKKFIDRPVLATVISILLVILGIIGLMRLPITRFPDISPPTVMVSGSYPGGNSEAVLRSVVTPLEEQINGVEDMTYMTSTSSNDGSAAINIYFKLGTNPDLAAVNVQNRVSRATSLLPQEVTRAGVTTMKRQSDNILIFSLYSENPEYDMTFLQNYANINIIPQIKRINGVGDASAFGQLDYAITPKLHLIPGIRYNYDRKIANYDRQTYGGLATTDPALLALKRAIYTNQQFDVDAQQRNVSGQATLQYVFSSKINTFATFSTTYKPIGVNVGGLPTANGRVLTELAEVKPEFVQHLEWGAKSRPSSNSILNVTFFSTTINDFQTQVQSPEPGVNRGYLANAEKVRVNGLELDGQISVGRGLVANGSFTYVDGRYVTFTNAPVPLEEVGGASAFKDISGERLPGISKYTGSIGLEATKRKDILDLKGNLFVGLDVFYRSSFSSSPTPSTYLNIEGYALTNLRAGFRATNGITFFVWGRNILDVDYYEQLLVAPGSAGQFAGVLGDPRTFGTTLRYSF
mgnify:CR=1 FL=1